MAEETVQKDDKIDEKSNESLENAVDKIIRHHVYVSMGMGLIPIPFADFIGVTGTQLNLLRKLSKIYNVPFSNDFVNILIGSLIGGAFPASLGPRLGWSLAKMIPGQSLFAVSTSAVSGACTYAVGKVFNRHFSEGGTFLSFDSKKARAYYEEMFKEGQKVTAENGK